MTDPTNRYTVKDQRRDGLLPAPRQTWVPAAPERRQAAPGAVYPVIDYSPTSNTHLAALESIRETATPVQRSVGLTIRLLPFSIVWLVLSVGVLVLSDSLVGGLLLFCALTAGSYIYLDRNERQDSAVGIEKHKAVLSASLRSKELDQAHELRSRALDAYIGQLEKRNHD